MALTSSPLVSVIVPAYNARRFIRETLASACAQSYRNLEIIVVDDGSTDDTATLVLEAAQKDPRIVLFQQANAGNSAARNMGFARSRGAFVASLDADDLWFPDKIERQLERFEESGPRVGLVYCWSLYIDTEGYPTGGYFAHREYGDVFMKLLCFNFVGNGSVPLMRREAIERSGGYRSYIGVEDMDLYLRIAPHFEFAVVPKTLVAYRQVSGSVSRNKRRMEQSYAAMLADLAHRHPDLPGHVIAWSRGVFHSYVAAKCYDEGRIGQAIESFARALAHDPSVMFRALAFVRGLQRVRRQSRAPHIRQILADAADPAAGEWSGGPMRPSPSPLGVLAPWRLAGLQRSSIGGAAS